MGRARHVRLPLLAAGAQFDEGLTKYAALDVAVCFARRDHGPVKCHVRSARRALASLTSGGHGLHPRV